VQRAVIRRPRPASHGEYIQRGLGLVVAMLMIATLSSVRVALAAGVSRNAAKNAVRQFCQAILARNGFSYWDFEGVTRERMRPLMSKRLLRTLDSVHRCGRDWASHQRPDSTDKPPFVDCCVFSASADWSPTSFVIQESEPLSDGRRRVVVEYRFDSTNEHARWHVAMYVVREGKRYGVDDFEGGLDEPKSERWFVLTEPPGCRSGKWVGGY